MKSKQPTEEEQARAASVFRLMLITGLDREEVERIVDSGGDLDQLSPDQMEVARRHARAFIKRCKQAERKREEEVGDAED